MQSPHDVPNANNPAYRQKQSNTPLPPSPPPQHHTARYRRAQADARDRPTVLQTSVPPHQRRRHGSHDEATRPASSPAEALILFPGRFFLGNGNSVRLSSRPRGTRAKPPPPPPVGRKGGDAPPSSSSSAFVKLPRYVSTCALPVVLVPTTPASSLLRYTHALSKISGAPPHIFFGRR